MNPAERARKEVLQGQIPAAGGQVHSAAFTVSLIYSRLLRPLLQMCHVGQKMIWPFVNKANSSCHQINRILGSGEPAAPAFQPHLPSSQS